MTGLATAWWFARYDSLVAINMRSYEYGKCAAALRNDFTSTGAEAMFDQAVTNGLLAIVAAEWPHEEFRKPKGNKLPQLRSATELLTVIREHSVEVNQGVHEFVSHVVTQDVVPPHFRRHWRIDASSTAHFQVDTQLLQDGIGLTQAVRHGHLRSLASASLEQKHIDALVALDEHPTLDHVSESERDRTWYEAKVFDLWSTSEAEDLLALIGDDEADRRAEAADRHAPAPGDIGVDIQDCPVCYRRAFIAHATDDLGYAVGIGTCIVCGYSRSEIIAEDQALDYEWKRRWAED